MSKWRWVGKVALLSALVWLISSCTLLPEPEKVRIYHLETPRANVPERPATPRPYVLEVRQPQASNALDSTRLAVYREGLGQAYWQNVRFADPVPRLVQRQLTDALRLQQVFRGVVQEQQGLAADWILLADLQDFSVRLNSMGCADSPASTPARTVQVRMHVDIMDAKQRTLLAGKTFSAAVSVAQNSNASDAENAVRALSQALAQVNREVAQWLVSLPTTAPE